MSFPDFLKWSFGVGIVFIEKRKGAYKTSNSVICLVWNSQVAWCIGRKPSKIEIFSPLDSHGQEILLTDETVFFILKKYSSFLKMLKIICCWTQQIHIWRATRQRRVNILMPIILRITGEYQLENIEEVCSFLWKTRRMNLGGTGCR